MPTNNSTLPMTPIADRLSSVVGASFKSVLEAELRPIKVIMAQLAVAMPSSQVEQPTPSPQKSATKSTTKTACVSAAEAAAAAGDGSVIYFPQVVATAAEHPAHSQYSLATRTHNTHPQHSLICPPQVVATVAELWDEYTKGLNGGPAIRELEATHGTKWRKYHRGPHIWQEKSAIYNAIEKLVAEGSSEEDAVATIQAKWDAMKPQKQCATGRRDGGYWSLLWRALQRENPKGKKRKKQASGAVAEE
jgi:hypothetical protein